MWNSIGNIFSAPEGGASDKQHKKGSSGVRLPPGPAPPRSTQLPTYGSSGGAGAGHPAAPSGGFFNLPSASAGAGAAGSGFHSHPPALQATLAPAAPLGGNMFG